MAAVVIAAAAGFAGGRLSAPETPASKQIAGTTEREGHAAPARGRDLGRPEPAVNPVERAPYAESRTAEAPPPDVVDALFSEALIERFLADFRTAWSKTRTDAPGAALEAAEVAAFKEQVLALGPVRGADAAESRTKQETGAKALADGDALGAIQAFADGSWQPKAAELEGDVLDRLTARRTQGADLDTEGLKAYSGRKGVPPGSTIQFPAGVHRFDPRSLPGPKLELADDVALAGTGMNSTLVVFETDTDFRADVRGFSIRDMTIVPANDGCGPIDHRGKKLTFTLNRVRFVGFDCGAGGSVCMDISTSALFNAADCEFLGGYGRNPEGYAYVLRGAKWLGRFDRCRFERAALWHSPPSASLFLFRQCVFVDPKADPLTPAAQSPAVRFLGCRTDVTLDPTKPAPRRDLAELFPDYRK